MTIYLDIDGVLLTTKDTKTVIGVKLFINFLVNHFDCFWLTTHCKGDSKYAIEYLKHFFDNSTIELLKRMRATNWNLLKTEAIDFNSDFYWLEDYPFKSEIKVLEEFGMKDRLLIVDLNRDNEYENLMYFLKNRLLQGKVNNSKEVNYNEPNVFN